MTDLAKMGVQLKNLAERVKRDKKLNGLNSTEAIKNSLLENRFKFLIEGWKELKDHSFSMTDFIASVIYHTVYLSDDDDGTKFDMVEQAVKNIMDMDKT